MKLSNPVFLSLVTVTLATAAACGGDSESFTTPSSGGSAGSGAGSGGSAGKGGTAGSGGSSATGGTTGGSAGKGGSGGKGGSAGSGTGGATGGTSGGTSGEGGDATGGTGMAGTGMAGTGAMTGYDPPDSQVDACTSTCVAAEAADCPNADTLAECVADCRFAIQIEACSPFWDALLACQEAVDPVTCNNDGEPAWPGCEDEYIAALDCVYNDALDPTLEEPCAGLCEAEQVVTCDNSRTVADCTTNCQVIGTAVPVCRDQYTGYLDCGAAAEEFTCDSDGVPQPAGCTGTQLALLACVFTEYGVAP